MSEEKDPVHQSIAATKAEYKRLGKSGLRVSVPILGAMSFGDKKWQEWVIEEDEALPLLKAAYDKGLNTWDTANVSATCPRGGLYTNSSCPLGLQQRRQRRNHWQSNEKVQHPA